GLDDLNARALGELPNGLGELEALDALNELDGVARLVATKAVVEAALRVDMEARRLLLVEGAHTDVAAAALLQPDGLPDQLYDPNLPPHAVEGLLSDHLPHILQIASGERSSLPKPDVLWRVSSRACLGLELTERGFSVPSAAAMRSLPLR